LSRQSSSSAQISDADAESGQWRQNQFLQKQQHHDAKHQASPQEQTKEKKQGGLSLMISISQKDAFRYCKYNHDQANQRCPDYD
jgi:hypothetical protein